MTHPDPPPRRGAHRTRRSAASALVPSLLAVLTVSALVTALLVWQGEDGDGPGAAASTTTPAPSRSASPSASGSAPASSAPASSAPESSAASSTSPAEETSAPPASTDLEVVVLNQTGRSGLAGSVADRLRGDGFDVTGTGNFTGVVPATTVYYPDGAARDARVVARALPVDPRTRPRFGNLSTTRLTVVVTDSYPN
jgi:pyruvate/2-oxoglutarate dehydrogenase complex dihydrolipoamide acyltransferase (E2) component